MQWWVKALSILKHILFVFRVFLIFCQKKGLWVILLSVYENDFKTFHEVRSSRLVLTNLLAARKSDSTERVSKLNNIKTII